MPGVRLDFLPQMADMHVQAVLVPVIVRAPDGLANGIIGYDVPAVIGQPLQQGALGGGQGQRCAVGAADGGVLQIDRAVPQRQHPAAAQLGAVGALRLLDPAKAAPILRANGLTAHSDSCVVTLPPLQDALLADLVQKLAACGAGVVELTPHTKTLEEIFLSLTSEEAD